MKKNKKVSIIFLIVLLCIFGIFGYKEYQNYQRKEQEEYIKIYTVYNCFSTEEYGKANPLNSIPLKTFQKNAPPQVEMDGTNGLYMKAMAYEYFTGNRVDYLDIEEKLNEGEALEVSQKYDEFITWVDTSEKEVKMYATVVRMVGVQNGYSVNSGDVDYGEYKEIIALYPEQIQAEIEGYTEKE